MSSIVNRRDSFISDILAMITGGTSNDVKIVLEDGEFMANKDVLSARSIYFATMFSNNKEIKFEEGRTNSVCFHCSKVIMEKVIQYLFSGDMKLHELSLCDLVKMMNMTAMMMLEDLNSDIREYVLELIPKSGIHLSYIPELVEALILADQFKLDIIKKALVEELNRSLEYIPHIPDVVKNFEAFKSLPSNLVKQILLEDADEEETRWADDCDIFYAFVFWLSGNQNQCSDEDKKEITNHIDLTYHLFTAERLLTDVRRSGLYSIKKVDDILSELLMEKDQRELENESKLKDKNAEIRSLKESVQKLKSELYEKEKVIANRNNLISANKISMNQKDEELRILGIRLHNRNRNY